MDLNIGMWQLFGYGRVPKKFEENRRGLDTTCFAMCQSGQKIEIEAGLTQMIGLSCNFEEDDNLSI